VASRKASGSRKAARPPSAKTRDSGGKKKASSAKKTRAVTKTGRPRAGERHGARPIARTKAPAGRRRVQPPPPRQKPIAVGDAVRIPVEAIRGGVRPGWEAAAPGRSGEAVSGIVCSIRSIKSGRLVAKTRGGLEQYVLEVLYGRLRGPVGARGGSGERLDQDSAWLRVRDVLRKMAARNDLVSQASGGLSGEPLGPLLDGWRVVKVRAELAEMQQ